MMKKLLKSMVLSISLGLVACTNQKLADSGIIGGADGPTTVFITTTQIDKMGILIVCGIALALVVGIGYLFYKKFKK